MSEDPSVVPASDPVPEPEPEGVVDVQGRRMVPVDALIAERGRVKDATEKKVREEYEPLKAKAAEADRLATDLAALQPHIDYLRKHPELLQAQPVPDIPDISTDDAEKYARRYELYTPTGLDIPRAKQIIADNRAETKRIAQDAAREFAAPAAARQNFIWAASQKGPDGLPLVDPNDLATVWQTFPPELAANPDVARVILEAAIGRAVRSGRHGSAPAEPQFTEAPGGSRVGGFAISRVEQKVARALGMSEKQYADAAKGYQPDAVNILGD